MEGGRRPDRPVPQSVELTASATASEAAEIRAQGAAAHVSANRTCEVVMEQATGEVYESVILLLEQATRDS